VRPKGCRLVALLTDFGLKDPFVGMMKAVILSRTRSPVSFLDLTHEVPAQDIRCGAFFLRAAAPYLPAGTLVVAVVDPGVGSARRILYARSGQMRFLAPDNGLLSWVGEDRPFEQVRWVRNRKLALPCASATFHGRDWFAPVAAACLSGLPSSDFGPGVRSIVRLPTPRFERFPGMVRGEVISWDRFGNCWTSLRLKDLPPGGAVFFKGRSLGPLRHHYAQVASGRPLAVAGSFGFVELSVRDGDFAGRLKAGRGDPVLYKFQPS